MQQIETHLRKTPDSRKAGKTALKGHIKSAGKRAQARRDSK